MHCHLTVNDINTLQEHVLFFLPRTDTDKDRMFVEKSLNALWKLAGKYRTRYSIYIYTYVHGAVRQRCPVSYVI